MADPVIDPVDRAHLTSVSRPSPPIHRYPPSGELAELIERFWIPVWSLTEPSTQRTLQHPVGLIVVSNSYARCYGVVRGLSKVTLDGDGWAVGVMFKPAAATLVFGRPPADLVDTHFDLADLDTLDGPALSATILNAMADPTVESSHRVAIAAYERALAGFVPIDEPGRLINAVIGWLADHPEVTRVAEVAAAFDLTERSLQRLVLGRVGLTPKWLIQRRRLHEAVGRLKAGRVALADLAAELGYADQAHFSNDFKAVTGVSPGHYQRDQG